MLIRSINVFTCTLQSALLAFLHFVFMNSFLLYANQGRAVDNFLALLAVDIELYVHTV